MKRSFHQPGAAAARLDITVPDEQDPAQGVEFMRWLAQMQSDLAESLNGIALRAARPIPIGTAPGGTTRPMSSPGRVVGWSLHETTGANPALLRLWDGRETGDRPLAYINIGQGGVVNYWTGGAGINVSEALLVEIVAGGGLSTAVEGVLYVGGVD